MKKSFVISILIILFAGLALSQTTVKVDLMKNSRLAIKGSTNILPFKLVHSGEKLLGKSITITATQNQNKIYLSQNQLAIQINNFTSDNIMALRDFKKLIKSDTYPSIKVQLNYIESASGNDKEVYSKGNASVNITITGVTRQYFIPVSSNKKDDCITIVGEKKMSIRDFGLEPPIEMLGLIKVSEWISIDFKMVCKLQINAEVTSIQ